MTSNAKTPKEYLEELPFDRSEAISQVREVILANLPAGYEEGIRYGMICYSVPLSKHPVRSGNPLAYVALGSQKHYMALYLMRPCLQVDTLSDFREAFLASGKKVDMGKGCVRFKRLEDLPLDVIAHEIASCPVDQLILESSRSKSI